MKRAPMRKIREALRLHANGMSTREMASSLSVGRTTLRGYRKAFLLIVDGQILANSDTTVHFWSRWNPLSVALDQSKSPVSTSFHDPKYHVDNHF